MFVVLIVYCQRPGCFEAPKQFRLVAKFRDSDHLEKEWETSFDGIIGQITEVIKKRGTTDMYICEDIELDEHTEKVEIADLILF